MGAWRKSKYRGLGVSGALTNGRQEKVKDPEFVQPARAHIGISRKKEDNIDSI
jgi:hypothetical protein